MFMKIICSALTICCLSGCYVFDANLPRPKVVYGKRGEDTIAVTAGTGFRNPGVHHVPRGTRLGDFIMRASVLPSVLRFPRVDYRLGQIRDGKGVGFHTTEPSSSQWETRLEDGAVVEIFKCNI